MLGCGDHHVFILVPYSTDKKIKDSGLRGTWSTQAICTDTQIISVLFFLARITARPADCRLIIPCPSEPPGEVYSHSVQSQRQYPLHTRRWFNVVLMLGRRQRRRANIKTTLSQRLALAGKLLTFHFLTAFWYYRAVRVTHISVISLNIAHIEQVTRKTTGNFQKIHLRQTTEKISVLSRVYVFIYYMDYFQQQGFFSVDMEGDRIDLYRWHNSILGNYMIRSTLPF